MSNLFNKHACGDKSNEQKDAHGGNMLGFVVGRSDGGGDRRFHSAARGGPQSGG